MAEQLKRLKQASHDLQDGNRMRGRIFYLSELVSRAWRHPLQPFHRARDDLHCARHREASDEYSCRYARKDWDGFSNSGISCVRSRRDGDEAMCGWYVLANEKSAWLSTSYRVISHQEKQWKVGTSPVKTWTRAGLQSSHNTMQNGPE